MSNFQNSWFHNRQSIQTLPDECVRDCTAPGPADEAVSYWVAKLQFDGPSWLIREHLSGYGAWDASELCDHKQNLERLLWIWACDVAEDPNFTDFYLIP